MNLIPTKEQLIELCEKSVVRCSNWHDRDSYSAQVNVQNIYRGLMLNLDYTLTIDDDYQSITVNFINCNKTQPDADKYNLDIDSLDDYFELRGSDSEMFYRSSEFDSWGGFLPTAERLQEADGSDWY